MGDGWRKWKEEKYCDLEAGVGNETEINITLYGKLNDRYGIECMLYGIKCMLYGSKYTKYMV